MNSRRPIQIDPSGCGCTECIVGDYVPLNYASQTQILDAHLGLIGNASGVDDLLEYLLARSVGERSKR